MARIVLLGPQRHQVTVSDVIEEFGLESPLAVITAGWQEREEEMEELDALVRRQTTNLRLHERAEEIFRSAPDFREAHREHQDCIKKMQDLYRIRLGHAQKAARELMDRQEKTWPDVLEASIGDAIETIRNLDHYHLNQIRALHESFQDKWRAQVSRIMDHHYELAEIIRSSSAVLIAGGHVAVLLNRMRLLELESLIKDRTIIAWSAGAMVLGQQIVVFHDSPPQGGASAEVFETGLGLYSGILPLPHARKRLMLDDPNRVSLFARRFEADDCLAMETGSRIDFTGERWNNAKNINRLTTDGKVVAWGSH